MGCIIWLNSIFMIPAKYALFAGISILINLVFQYLSILMYSGYASLYFAMVIGTAFGLGAKYLLDKKFIFYYKKPNKSLYSPIFFYYVMTGMFTTLIFWGIEITFHTLYSDPSAKYVGALIGLTIGYFIKYFLDKKYVFI
jgi:putative flippase GtrA